MAQNRLVAAALEEVGFYVYLREKNVQVLGECESERTVIFVA